MAYDTLKTAIADVVKTNGNKEITGDLLQQVLFAMVSSLGAGYQFFGFATPSTNPGTPDQKVFYLAHDGGNYVNFGLVVPHGLSLLLYNDGWSLQTIFKIQNEPAENSQNIISSGGVYSMTKFVGSRYPLLDDTKNANDIRDNSIYLAINAQGMPTETGVFVLTVLQSSGSKTATNRWIVQLAVSDSDGEMYQRIGYYNGTTTTWKNWIHIADANKILSYISANSIGREKLANDFLCNFPLIGASGDVNTALTEGHYMVLDGAANAPIGGTLTLIVHTFKTTPTGNIWTVQIANTADGDARSFIRKCYNGASFSDWVELTNRDAAFVGKKIACFGDSITEQGDYPARFAAKTGATVYKCGFGGCRMSTYGGTTGYSTMCMSFLSDYIANNNFTDLINGAQQVFEQYGDDNRPQANIVANINYSELDYMILFWGTNDYGGNIPIGNDTDETHDTFKGAINLVVKNILTAYPNIHLIFVTPFWRATYTGTSEFCDSDIYTNPLGFKLPDYVNALISRANALHVPVLNLYDSMCIGKYNYTEWLADGLHPKSGKGYEYVAQKIVSGFKQFYHQ